MTHFNHDWDTTKTPAVPVSIGDRYYAQDLNDDFNYLKHLPYEVFLQGKSRGVMVAPKDTWNSDAQTLTLSGGFGVILQDCIELDPNESFTIPPKTHSSPRYERISFVDTTFILPPDDTMYYIVATPKKRSLLQRAKTLFTEQYASRIRYDGIITVQGTAPTAGQILIGLCCNKEYCLLIDNNPDQCKDNIILKKWFGQNKIIQDFVPALQSYYSTSIASIETEINIFVVDGHGISAGTFNNCTINISTVGNGSYGISAGTFNNCTINIGMNGIGIYGGVGISAGTFNNCTINISTVGKALLVSGNGLGVNGGTFNNCAINVNTVDSGGIGVNNGTFNSCTIIIGTVSDGGVGITDVGKVDLNLTHIRCTAITSLNNTSGKLNILNGTVLHAS